MNRVWRSAALVELTAADDGLSHRVSRDVYEQCVADGRGQYLTLCRRTVLTAAMTTRPGPVCRACRQVVHG